MTSETNYFMQKIKKKVVFQIAVKTRKCCKKYNLMILK